MQATLISVLPWLAAIAGGGPDPAPWGALEAPVRLAADGEVIDVGEHVGHAGPLFADFDQRGVPDLLVGTFRGHILLFRNQSRSGAPVLEAQGMLEAAGKPIRVPNW